MVLAKYMQFITTGVNEYNACIWLPSRLNIYLKIFFVIINTLIKQLRLYEQRAPWIDVFSSVQNV